MLIVVVGVRDDGMKYSCAELWLYLAGGAFDSLLQWQEFLYCVPVTFDGRKWQIVEI